MSIIIIIICIILILIIYDRINMVYEYTAIPLKIDIPIIFKDDIIYIVNNTHTNNSSLLHDTMINKLYKHYDNTNIHDVGDILGKTYMLVMPSTYVNKCDYQIQSTNNKKYIGFIESNTVYIRD